MKPVFGRVEEPKQSFFRLNIKRALRSDFLWHFHHLYELNLMVRSRGTRFVGDSIAHYEDGDLVLMAPNLPHTWYADPRLPGSQGPHHSIGIQFTDAFLGEHLLQEPDWKHIGLLFERSARGVNFTGETRQAVAEQIIGLENLRGPARLITFLSILNLLAQCEDCEILSSKEFNPSQHSSSEKRIDKVCFFVSENYTYPITLDEVAEIANLSVSAFSQFFKITIGKTLTAYVNELRVGLACKLLVETESSIADIAFEAGFNNLSNFNRRFLKSKKVSPKIYRQQYLSSAVEAKR